MKQKILVLAFMTGILMTATNIGAISDIGVWLTDPIQVHNYIYSGSDTYWELSGGFLIPHVNNTGTDQLKASMINATNNVTTPMICLGGDCQTEWPIGGTGASKWVDRGSYLQPNSTYANNIYVIGYFNVTGNVTTDSYLVGNLDCSQITGGDDGNFCSDSEGAGGMDTNASTACGDGEVLLGEDSGLCLNLNDTIDARDSDTTYSCSDWSSCSDDSLWDADKVDGQDYSDAWPTNLSNIQSATSSDFHNIGGTDLDTTYTHLSNFTDDIGVSSDWDECSDASGCGWLTDYTDTNASTACSGTTTYLDGEGNCDILNDLNNFTDSGNIYQDDVGSDCSADNYVYGIQNDGTLLCRQDQTSGGGGGSPHWIDAGIYLYPNTSYADNVNITNGWLYATDNITTEGNLVGNLDCSQITGGDDGNFCSDSEGAGVNESDPNWAGNYTSCDEYSKLYFTNESLDCTTDLTCGNLPGLCSSLFLGPVEVGFEGLAFYGDDDYTEFFMWDNNAGAFNISDDLMVQGMNISGYVNVSAYPNCNLETDSGGLVYCGTDDIGDSYTDTNASTACGDGEVLLGEDSGLCLNLNDTIDARDSDTTYSCSDWSSCSDDSLWNADKVDGHDYSDAWPTNLSNIQSATSNDFHNIGGTDDDDPESISCSIITGNNSDLCSITDTVGNPMWEYNDTYVYPNTSYGDFISIGNSNVENYIYFYSNGDRKGEYIRWDPMGYFYLSGNIYIENDIYTSSNIHSSGDIYTQSAGNDLWLGNSNQGSASFRAYANGELYGTNAYFNNLSGSLSCSNIYGNASNLCTLTDTDTTYTHLSNFTDDIGVSSDWDECSDASGCGWLTDYTDTNASTACGDGEVLLGEDSGLCLNLNDTIDARDSDTTYSCSDWSSCSDDSLWDADKVDGQDYSDAWPTNLSNIQSATSSDFHNIGGTDDDNPDDDSEVPDAITVNSTADINTTKNIYITEDNMNIYVLGSGSKVCFDIDCDSYADINGTWFDGGSKGFIYNGTNIRILG